MNKKIKYINNKKIITINDQEYISKEYKDNDQIYNYLVKVGFTSFIKPTKYNDKEELIPYVKEYYLSNEIIDIITDLHNRTTKYQKPDKLKQKELYINIKNKIFNTRNYYLKVQDKLEKIIDKEKDSIRFYYLGNNYKTKVEHMGAKESFSVEEPLII